MIRRIAVVLTLLGVAVSAAQADEAADKKRAQGIQGNYQGAFGAGEWATTPLKAQIIANSLRDFDVKVYLGDPATEQPVGALHGKTDGDGATTFSGSLDLERQGEAAYECQASLVREGRIEGVFTKKRAQVSFALDRVELGSPTLGARIPDGGVLLFDGANMDAWELYPNTWSVESGAFYVTTSSIVTKQAFGSGEYHVEFVTPFMPNDRGQGRGNSGVYVQGRYEVQVLDTFGLEAADNFCGGIYKQAVPRANACLPPGEWQTYDITFHVPQFDANGAKTKNAHIKVLHNGILIHDLDLTDRTPGGMDGGEMPLAPILLQHHGNQVGYRNIWVKPID